MYVISTKYEVEFLLSDGSKERMKYGSFEDAMQSIETKDFFRADLYKQTLMETRDTFIKKKDES